MIALASAPWGVSAKSHPFRPMTKGRMAFSTWLLLISSNRSIIPRYRKAVVPSTHSAENHDFIFLTMGADHHPQSLCSALRAQAICRARAPCTHALTDLLSPMNQPSPLNDSCGSLCFRYCHVLPSIVFQVYLFSGFQFFKYYG